MSSCVLTISWNKSIIYTELRTILGMFLFRIVANPIENLIDCFKRFQRKIPLLNRTKLRFRVTISPQQLIQIRQSPQNSIHILKTSVCSGDEYFQSIFSGYLLATCYYVYRLYLASLH